jgi:hypothetical protein
LRSPHDLAYEHSWRFWLLTQLSSSQSGFSA